MTASLNSSLVVDYSRKGQAALTLVFLIGGIIVLVGVTLAFLAIGFVNSGLGFQTSERALAGAYSGVHDAVVQLIRNKDFSSAGYSFSVGSGSVTVAVQNAGSGTATITSVATFGIYQRKIRAITSINTATGQVFLVSWQEISF